MATCTREATRGSTKNTKQTQRQIKKKGPAICGETEMKEKVAKTDKAE